MFFGEEGGSIFFRSLRSLNCKPKNIQDAGLYLTDLGLSYGLWYSMVTGRHVVLWAPHVS